MRMPALEGVAVAEAGGDVAVGVRRGAQVRNAIAT